MSKIVNSQKHIRFERHGDKIEVIVRNSSFIKLFHREVSLSNRKELERLLIDLKDKGADLIGIIRKRMLDGSGWFD